MLICAALFPVRAPGSGFSLSGRPLGYNRVIMVFDGAADFLCRKTQWILIGGLQSSTNMAGRLWEWRGGSGNVEEGLVLPYGPCSAQISSDLPRSVQISSHQLRSAPISSDQVRSAQISSDQFRSAQVSSDSGEVSSDQPRSAQIS